MKDFRVYRALKLVFRIVTLKRLRDERCISWEKMFFRWRISQPMQGTVFSGLGWKVGNHQWLNLFFCWFGVLNSKLVSQIPKLTKPTALLLNPMDPRGKYCTRRWPSISSYPQSTKPPTKHLGHSVPNSRGSRPYLGNPFSQQRVHPSRSVLWQHLCHYTKERLILVDLSVSGCYATIPPDKWQDDVKGKHIKKGKFWNEWCFFDKTSWFGTGGAYKSILNSGNVHERAIV